MGHVLGPFGLPRHRLEGRGIRKREPKETLPAEVTVASLQVEPTEMRLQGRFAYQQLLVTAVLAGAALPFEQRPRMKADEVTDVVLGEMRTGKYDFVRVNYANGDMVGHTAVRESVIQAVEVLDREVGRVVDAAGTEGYSVILTADHGNCDEYIDPLTGDLVYRYDYRNLEAFAEYSFKLGGQSVALFGNYTVNTEADDNDTGYLIGAKYGSAKKRGQWDITYFYENLEADDEEDSGEDQGLDMSLALSGGVKVKKPGRQRPAGPELR